MGTDCPRPCSHQDPLPLNWERQPSDSVGRRRRWSRRAMIECIFGWGKQHGTMRKTKHRGIRGVTADIMLNLIVYDLIHIPRLIAA